MSAWSKLATSPSTTSIAPSPPASASVVRRVWDNQCCEVQANQLLDVVIDHVERARYLSSRAPGSGDWLHTLTLSSIGLKIKMYNATVCIADGLRLGTPFVRPHTYAKLRAQSMVIMDYLVATAQDDIIATIKSTRFCVVHLSPPLHMQLDNHNRSLVAMSRGQMEQQRFRGRGAVVWLGTPPAPTHTHSHMC